MTNDHFIISTMKQVYLAPAVRCSTVLPEKVFLASALVDFDEQVIYEEEEQ